ncbi:uncharacterized protein LOC102914915 isoform X4 [Peromyscus maniculatus bairdii]|uniref:uncharacterized protein LOC102914915 isoform X4 n=1 Tax=Peromyscus maniculatus bairdii TaxID=230844 RepID=UPI003FD67B3B
MGRGRRFSPRLSLGGDRWGECGGWSMRCRFRVTVRIRGRAGRPPRVKAFVVQFPRSSRPRAASRERAVVAVLLMLVRSQPTGPQLHPDQTQKLVAVVVLSCNSSTGGWNDHDRWDLPVIEAGEPGV